MQGVIPWKGNKWSGQHDGPNFLPGDTFQITLWEGESQREHLEIAKQTSRKERATQKMMVPLNLSCFEPHMHRMKLHKSGKRMFRYKLSSCYCSQKMGSSSQNGTPLLITWGIQWDSIGVNTFVLGLNYPGNGYSRPNRAKYKKSPGRDWLIHK